MNAISEDRVLIVEEPNGRGVPVIDGWSLAALLRDMGGEQIRLVAVTDAQLVGLVSPNQMKQTLRQLLAH
jgi:hypothetical protein